MERTPDLLNARPAITLPPDNNAGATKNILYRANPEHLCCEMNGEAVILSLENGKYYGVNSVGARVWELIQDFTAQAALEEIILDEYNVEPEICRREINDFLQAMIAENLIVARDNENTADAAIRETPLEIA